MEGDGSAGGDGVLCATQEPRAAAAEEKARVGESRAGGGAMKFRVCARAPQGVGALLLIGGAALVGAAVVAWRHAHRRGGKDDRQPAKKEVLDGRVVEDGKDRMSAREIDLSDENLHEEKADIGSHELEGEVVQEIQQINSVKEIVTDKPDSEPVGKLDDNSKSNPTGVSMHDAENEHVEKFEQNSSMKHDEITNMDNEHVEKFDQSSSTKPAEITTHDMDSANVERGDENSSKNDAENENSSKNDAGNENSSKNYAENENSSKNDTENENSTKNDTENENSTKNDFEILNSSKNHFKKEIGPNDNEDMVTSDQSTLSISGPGIALHKHSNHNDDGAQEAESMENTPTPLLMMHQEQLLDDMMTDAVTETAIAKLAEGKIIDKSEAQQVEKKALEELVQLVCSQALSTLVKPIEKKEPEPPGPFETGMKMEQDRRTNGELKEHDLSRTGAIPGGAVVTMDRRSISMAIFALLFALTIGITIIVRLCAPPRATKLQMDSQ